MRVFHVMLRFSPLSMSARASRTVDTSAVRNCDCGCVSACIAVHVAVQLLTSDMEHHLKFACRERHMFCRYGCQAVLYARVSDPLCVPCGCSCLLVLSCSCGIDAALLRGVAVIPVALALGVACPVVPAVAAARRRDRCRPLCFARSLAPTSCESARCASSTASGAATRCGTETATHTRATARTDRWTRRRA